MRRDERLIYRILEHIEQNDSLPKFDDSEEAATKYHLSLAITEGYIDGVIVSKPLGDHPDIIHQIRKPQLTTEGHEYLEEVRSNSVCRRVFFLIAEHTTAVFIAVVGAVLGAFALWWFGFKQ